MKSTGTGELPVSVLYVDDEPALLEIGKLFLEQAGDITVTTAEGAEEAIQLIKGRHFDGIVSDYQMPGMDGIAFLKHLRESGNTIPFIIFTGKGREEVVIEALNSGADFYLQKGGDPKSQFAELTNMIRAAISHKMAEKLAKETEKRLYDIIQFLPDPTFAIDSSGVVIAWNHAIEEMTGIAAQDMVGKGNYEYAVPVYGERRPILIDLVSIADDELLQSKYASIRREGDILIAEIAMPGQSGGYAIFAGKASPLYNEDGEVVGAIETLRDITEQRRSEEALQESEERYRLTLDAANDGIWDWDITSGSAFFSDRWYTMLGDKPGEMPGSYATWRSLVHPDDLKRAEDFIQNHIREEKGSFQLEFRMLTKDGGWRWILARGRIVSRDAEGKPLRLLGTHTDITGRKETEKALEESERLYRLITENMTETITIMDLSFRFRYVSPSIEALRGYTVLEALSQSLEDILAPDSLAIAHQTFHEAMAREAAGEPVGVMSLDLETYHRDGRTIWVNNTMTVLRDSDGVATAILIVGRDVTERKRAELDADRNNRLIEAMLDGIPDIVGVQLPDHTILRYNKAGYEILGLTPGEVEGRRCFEIIGRTSPCEDCATTQAVRSKKLETVERYIPEFGKYLECTSNPVLDENGEVEQVIEILHDITGWKESEEELLRSEERFKTIFMESPVSIIIHDRDSGGIIDANTKACSSYGISSVEELKAHDFWMEPPYSFNEAYALLQKAAAEGPQEFEWQSRSVTGERFWEQVRLITVVIGGVERILAIAVDITEQKRAEEALLATERRFRTLFENMTAGFVLFEVIGDETNSPVDLRILEANKGFATIAGLKTEDIIGKSLTEVLPGIEHDRADWIKRYGNVAQTGVPLRFEQGSELLGIEFDIAAYQVEPGQCAVTFSDITKRKRQEEELEGFFTVNLDLLCIADLDGNFIKTNEAWSTILGYSTRELNTRKFLDFVHPEDMQATLDAIADLKRGEEVLNFTNRYLCKDGSYRHIEWRSHPKGNLIYAAARDITERVAAEEALQEANKKLSLLSSITRHDILNNIMILKGYIELGSDMSSNPKLTGYLNEMEKATSSIQKQIEFTRLYEEIGVTVPAWQTIDDLIGLIDTPHIPIQHCCHGIAVFADPMIEKVFFNLMTNTIRHAEGASRVTICCEEQDGRLAILWEDDGPGIPDDQKERIFERGVGKNTGFGLFLSREILSITGIAITECGAYGTGARFEMVVPKTGWKREQGDSKLGS